MRSVWFALILIACSRDYSMRNGRTSLTPKLPDASFDAGGTMAPETDDAPSPPSPGLPSSSPALPDAATSPEGLPPTDAGSGSVPPAPDPPVPDPDGPPVPPNTADAAANDVCPDECTDEESFCFQGRRFLCRPDANGCFTPQFVEACLSGSCTDEVSCTPCTGECCGAEPRTPCHLDGSLDPAGYCQDNACVECTRAMDCAELPGHPACITARCEENHCRYSALPADHLCAASYCQGGVFYETPCGEAASCTPTPVNCNGYVCDDASGCRDSCETDAHCEAGGVCFEGSCVFQPFPLGTPCSGNQECEETCIGNVCSSRHGPGGVCDGTDSEDCNGNGLVCEISRCRAALGAVCTTTASCQEPWVCHCFGVSECVEFRCAEVECAPCFNVDRNGQCTVQVSDGWQHKCELGFTCQAGACVPLSL